MRNSEAAIKNYQEQMTNIMMSAANKELELVLLDLAKFSVHFSQTLVRIWEHLNKADDSEESIGNPNYIVLRALVNVWSLQWM